MLCYCYSDSGMSIGSAPHEVSKASLISTDSGIADGSTAVCMDSVKDGKCNGKEAEGAILF